jgi:hypothetical protein
MLKSKCQSHQMIRWSPSLQLEVLLPSTCPPAPGGTSPAMAPSSGAGAGFVTIPLNGVNAFIYVCRGGVIVARGVHIFSSSTVSKFQSVAVFPLPFFALIGPHIALCRPTSPWILLVRVLVATLCRSLSRSLQVQVEAMRALPLARGALSTPSEEALKVLVVEGPVEALLDLQETFALRTGQKLFRMTSVWPCSLPRRIRSFTPARMESWSANVSSPLKASFHL